MNMETALPEPASEQVQDYLRALLDHSSDCIYFKDRSSRFQRCSRAMCERFHLKLEEIIGKTDFDLFDELHAKAALRDEEQILETGQPVHGKIEREVLKDGKVEWALTSKFPLLDKNHQIVGTFGISKNITVIKETEAELARERNLMCALMEHATDRIYFKDLQSRFLRCSKSKWQRHGDSEADVIGKSDFDFYNERDAQAAFDDEQEIIRTGAGIQGKIEHLAVKNGAEVWTLVSKMPFTDESGKIVGTFGISKDITDMKEAERKLEKVNRQLVDASRMAGMAEVATSVLHNVGNVLNSVNVSTSLMLDAVNNSKIKAVARLAGLLREHQDNLPEFFASNPKGKHVPDFLDSLAAELAREQQKFIDEMQLTRKNIEHIKDIVMMQQGYAKFAGVLETVKPVDLIEDALRMNSAALTRHDVQVVRDFAPGVGEITAEKHKILQILVNLIRNAKYACDDSARQEKIITLQLRNGGGSVKIAVIDNGVGVPPENLNRIFNHGFTTRAEGHGFGLHSGALAAREMGGTLTAESDGPGKGARFTLELPVQPPSGHHQN